jgi:hypothetical protein
MAPVTRSKARALARATTLANTGSTKQRQTNEQDGDVRLSNEVRGAKVTGKRNRKNEKKAAIVVETIEAIETILAPESLEVVEVTKKIKLTEEEANLNGAPEGELYDVAVLSDEALTPLTQPDVEFAIAFDTLSCLSSTWASRHNSIEILRRVCRFHSDLFSAVTIKVAFNECCLEIESLRSCVSRNGISCLKALYQLNFAWTDDLSPVYERSIHLLVNKSSSGPKFLCALATESLEIGLLSIPYPTLIPIFQPFNSHKNPEISSRSFSLVAQRVLSLHNICDLSSPSPHLLVQYCQYLSLGIHSLRPQSREISKKALLKFFQLLGKESSLVLIEQSIASEKKTELFRLVEESEKTRTECVNVARKGESSVAEKENSKEKNRSKVRPAWKQLSTKLPSSDAATAALLII